MKKKNHLDFKGIDDLEAIKRKWIIGIGKLS